MSLRERLIAEIAENGPMTVSAYMTRCLHDPVDGYYATRPRLGADGDFITAPHVSQMFGELIGLWAAEIWLRLGQPETVRLAELGPGDGTMMADMLRAGRAAPGFVEAAQVWLVETSAPLRALQAQALEGHAVNWAARLEDLPTDAPLIIVGNEFLDCLPADQFVNTEQGWMERMIGLDDAGELVFGAAPCQSMRFAADQPPGTICSVSRSLADAAFGLSTLIARAGGAALLIDYGGDFERVGDSLQAVREHAKESPLASPGEADLTVRVDFGLFRAMAAGQGPVVEALMTQGDFLRALGIESRADTLARANPDRADLIARQLQRLIGDQGMGELFKAACLHSPELAAPGFGGAA